MVTAARQQITSEWWETSKEFLDLYIATPVLEEASMGDKNAAQKRLSILEKLPVLKVTNESLDFAKFLIDETPFPQNAQVDVMLCIFL